MEIEDAQQCCSFEVSIILKWEEPIAIPILYLLRWIISSLIIIHLDDLPYHQL